MVKIVKNLVSKSQQKIKCPYTMTPEYVGIHNTGNDASAANEVSYMRSNSNQVSFHYAVDDKQIVQGIEENRNAWHAGDGSNGKGNRKAISIEICYSKSGGSKFDAAEKNAAELAASILKRYGWGIDRLKKHQDFNGKYCPHRTLDRGWSRFVKMVEGYLNPASTNKPVDKAPVATYRVRAGGKWLPAVTDLKDYAGVVGQTITDVAIKVSSGSVKYRVHIKGGKWLPYVTGYSTTDHNNGYAGYGKAIDAIEVRYTPAKGAKSRKAKYRISPVKGGYWPWQTNADKSKTMDGYAGAFGVTMDRLQITIE